jgi:pimeloyl-ACP methyl ester carboxylesterase
MTGRLILFAAALAGSAARSQGPNPQPPVYGVHYSFEKMTAVRHIRDRHDNGIVRLVSYVFRPLQNDRHEVVVDLHGSLGGVAVAPGEPVLPLSRPKLNLLLQRGYTVVVPMRRGLGESEGQFVEECAYQAGKCTLAEYRKLMPNGLSDALASTKAVMQQVVLGKLKPRSGKAILWGGSRGGILALHYAATYPDQVRAVIAVSPGWLSLSEKWPKEEVEERLSVQRQLLARAGKGYRGPTLWIYAARDPFYAGPLTRQLFEAFTSAGGEGHYVYVQEHSLPSGHVPPVDLWHGDAERFLQQLQN